MVNKQIWWAAKLYNRVWNSLSGTHMTIREGLMANKNKSTNTKISESDFQLFRPKKKTLPLLCNLAENFHQVVINPAMTIILNNNNLEATIRSLKLLRFELSMIMVIRSTLLRSIMMKIDSHLQDLSKAIKSLIEFWERATCILLSRLIVHKLIKVVQRVRYSMTSKAL
jgi:hypothetical protein